MLFFSYLELVCYRIGYFVIFVYEIGCYLVVSTNAFDCLHCTGKTSLLLCVEST